MAAIPSDPGDAEFWGGTVGLALARALVVLGPDATLPNVSRLSGLGQDRVRHWCDEMVGRGRVLGGGTLRLADPSHSDTLIATSDRTELSRLHYQAAIVLRDAGAGPRELAQHLLATDPVGEEWVVDVLDRAAVQHEEAGDQPAKVATWRRLLAERLPMVKQRQILGSLAHAETHLDPVAAIEHFRELIAITDDPAERAGARLAMARCLGNVQDVAGAMEEADRAAREAPDMATRLRADLLYVATSRMSLDMRPLGHQRLRQVTREAAEAEPVDGATLYAETAYEACLAGDPVDDILPLVRRAVGGPTMSGVHDLEPASLHVAVLTLIWCGELREAERAAQLVLARSNRRGQLVVSALANHWLTQVAWRRSRFDECISFADSVLGTAERSALPLFPATRGFKALALAMKGDAEGAAHALDLPGGDDQWSALAHFHGYLHCAARVSLMLGDPAAAYRTSMRLGTLATSMGTMNPGILPWRAIAALALSELGDFTTGTALADEAVSMTRRFGAPGPLALALRARAANQTHPEEQLALLEESLRWGELTPDRFERAQCLVQMSRSLETLGRADAAATCLETAADLAQEVGAAGLHAAALRLRHDLDRSNRYPTATAPPPVAPPSDEIRVLGEFTVTDSQGRDVTPVGVPGKALRILVAAGGRLHLEELGDRLWDEPIDVEQLRKRLRNVISRARGAGGPLIIRRDEMVELRPGTTVDATRFEEAATRALERRGEGALEAGLVAVSLYRGDLLPSDPYAEWAALARERLRRRFLTVVDVTARLAAEAGALDVATDLLETGIHYEPYDDERYDRAAALYEQGGRLAEAESLRRRAGEVRAGLGLPA